MAVNLRSQGMDPLAGLIVEVRRAVPEYVLSVVWSRDMSLPAGLEVFAEETSDSGWAVGWACPTLAFSYREFPRVPGYGPPGWSN